MGQRWRGEAWRRETDARPRRGHVEIAACLRHRFGEEGADDEGWASVWVRYGHDETTSGQPKPATVLCAGAAARARGKGTGKLELSSGERWKRRPSWWGQAVSGRGRGDSVSGLDWLLKNSN